MHGRGEKGACCSSTWHVCVLRLCIFFSISLSLSVSPFRVKLMIMIVVAVVNWRRTVYFSVWLSQSLLLFLITELT